MAIKTKKKHPVQWTVEVTWKPGDSEFTRFYSKDEYWEFMETCRF
jgi:hypothetical protein